MPEENIASYSWRRRTSEFSPLCDNAMTLDNTSGLVDSPMRQNSIGICRPACEMCITPFPGIREIDLTCSNKIWLEGYFGSPLPTDPDEPVLPGQFTARWVSGAWNAQHSLAGTDIVAGDALQNIGETCATESFVMSWDAASQSWVSDWHLWGTRHELVVTQQCNASGEVATTTTTWDAEFRATLNATSCGRIITIQTRAKNINSSSDGIITNFGCKDWFQRTCGVFPQENLFYFGFFWNPQLANPGIQQINTYQHGFDPLKLYIGNMGTRYTFADPLALRTCCYPIASCEDPLAFNPSFDKWAWMLSIEKRTV